MEKGTWRGKWKFWMIIINYESLFGFCMWKLGFWIYLTVLLCEVWVSPRDNVDKLCVWSRWMAWEQNSSLKIERTFIFPLKRFDILFNLKIRISLFLSQKAFPLEPDISNFGPLFFARLNIIEQMITHVIDFHCYVVFRDQNIFSIRMIFWIHNDVQ